MTLEIIFLESVNVPNAERAAELLGPIVADMWQKSQDNELQPEQAIMTRSVKQPSSEAA